MRKTPGFVDAMRCEGGSAELVGTERGGISDNAVRIEVINEMAQEPGVGGHLICIVCCALFTLLAIVDTIDDINKVSRVDMGWFVHYSLTPEILGMK